MKFGIEIFSEGYKSAIRIYQNGKDVSDLYRDEIQYVNQRIAMVVSRYREMYRYQIMMSSTYGGGYIVEFDANQIRDIGFDGIDLVYSDLESLSIQFSEELNSVIDTVLDAYVYSRTCNDVCGVLSRYVDDSDRAYWVELLDKVVNGIAGVLERFYVYYVGLLTNLDNQVGLNRGGLRTFDGYQEIVDDFLDVVLNRHDIPDYYECGGIVFNYDDISDRVDMFIPIEKLSNKVMASRVFDIGKFMRSYVDMVEEYSKGIYSIS